MTDKELLQIFKSGFRKMKLKRISRIGNYTDAKGVKYERYLGLFEFILPYECQINHTLDYSFLRRFLKKYPRELNHCTIKKFTRKIFNKENLKKQQVLKYVFNVIPKNIVSFRFYKHKRIAKMVIAGYKLK